MLDVERIEPSIYIEALGQPCEVCGATATCLVDDYVKPANPIFHCVLVLSQHFFCDEHRRESKTFEEPISPPGLGYSE